MTADRTWTLQAACRTSGLDPDTWFPTQGDELTADTAKRICRTCPVQLQCAIYAEHTHATHGIWAGHRRNIRGQLNGHHKRAHR